MNRKSFGKQLQKYRERAGYSQEKLAEKIECSTIFISYIERGVKSPGLDNLIRLANALDVSADLLLGTAISTYNLTMLKDIEKRIQMLPASEWIFLCGSTAVPEERIPPIQRQETAVPEQRYRT